MAIGSVYVCDMRGTICDAPFSVELCYLQREDAPQFPNPGANIARAFFADDPGPWVQIRNQMSTEMKFDCMIVRERGTQYVETVFIENAVGLQTVATTSLPSYAAIQINTPPVRANEGEEEGRFFWPGWTHQAFTGGHLNASMYQVLEDWYLQLQQIDTFGIAPNTRYSLIPHKNFFGPGDDNEMIVGHLYADLFMKRIKSRSGDLCQAFAAGSFNPPANQKVTAPPPPV